MYTPVTTCVYVSSTVTVFGMRHYAMDLVLSLVVWYIGVTQVFRIYVARAQFGPAVASSACRHTYGGGHG